MWPKLPTPTGDGTILLFYGYVTPEWTRAEQDASIDFACDNVDTILVHLSTSHSFPSLKPPPTRGVCRALLRAVADWGLSDPTL